VRFARIDMLFGRDQSAEESVDVVLANQRFMLNDDTGFQRALEQV